MREIKFRAWDKKMKIFIYGIERTYDWPSAICMPERYTLTQFVGLYDTDGKEVYEEDIIQVGEIGRTIFLDIRKIPNLVQDAMDRRIYFKVIGNSYENPELQ